MGIGRLTDTSEFTTVTENLSGVRCSFCACGEEFSAVVTEKNAVFTWGYVYNNIIGVIVVGGCGSGDDGDGGGGGACGRGRDGGDDDDYDGDGNTCFILDVEIGLYCLCVYGDL